MNDNRLQRFGATLYVPALNHMVDKVRLGSVPHLGAMVICLEDAIRDDQVPEALHALRRHLADALDDPAGPTVYVRPRSPWMAEEIMGMAGVDRIRGFVIPKATADTLPDWVSIMRGGRHALMPTLETAHAFDIREVHRMRDQVATLGVTVDVVRIGGNDILATIGARRSSKRTLYDGPLGPVVTGIVGAFANTGIMLSSPVLEHYSDETLLVEEIERDVEHGIFNKTAIHPRQVAIINDALRPTAAQMGDALAILDEDARAVFGNDGSMCEPKTHAAWARLVVARAKQLGVHDDGCLPVAV
jgi:citrate lyase beta subunit